MPKNYSPIVVFTFLRLQKLKRLIKTLKKSEISNEPIIIAESEELIKTISVGEALMLMKLNDQNAIFFKNIQTKRLNLLFKRSDGNIGWLDPKK